MYSTACIFSEDCSSVPTPHAQADVLNSMRANNKCFAVFAARQVKAQFKPDAKLLIGYKTKRSAEACRLLADAGFTELFNVESRTFMKTRLQQAWE